VVLEINVAHCIFCGVELRPSHLDLPDSKTREHILARWIRDAVTKDEMLMFEAQEGKSVTLQRSLTIHNLVNVAVCKACNGGWMMALENCAEPIIQELGRGKDINSLSSKDVECVARWTAKTAATLSFVTPQKRRVPEEDCRSIHPNSRHSPRCQIFFCRAPVPPRIEGAYLQLVYGTELLVSSGTNVAGTRILLCVNNQCFIADFSPVPAATQYDLTSSPSAGIWPRKIAPGERLNQSSDSVDVLLHKIAVSVDATLDLKGLRS
jgi:hypothetical protein